MEKEKILKKHCPSMDSLFLDDNGEKFRSRIFDAMDEYSKQQTKPDWVSVEDGLPENMKDIIVHTESGEVIDNVTYKDLDGFMFHRLGYDFDCYYVENVTHWQPLPQPPKTK